ncbi:MAG: hypothetical protein IT165_13945 [Bryobacterales bacterium]|nr:hypothetical protein [Bryobacterales bacterium]
MNPGNHHPRDADNARNMIGGYASGNLSPQEKEKLFEAALHQQDLFDALMGEQALKDFLEQPGVKAELVEALQPKPTLWRRLRQWFTSPAAYAAAGALAAAAVLIVVVLNRPSSHQAAVEMTEPPLPMVTETTTPPPAAEREPATAPSKRKDMAAPPAPKPGVAQTPIPQQNPEERRQQAGSALDQLSSKREQAALRDEAQQSLPTNAPAAAPGGLASGVIGGAVPAPAPPAPEQSLSVSYTLLRRGPNGRYLPVTTPTVASTDSLRLQVTPNGDGALYLYTRNEAGLEAPLLNGLPLSRGQTAVVPQSGGFSAARGATRLVLVFRQSETASDSKELAPQAFRQRARSVSEKDNASPPPPAVAASAPIAGKAVLPAAGPSRVSAPSPAVREVSVEIAINAGPN